MTHLEEGTIVALRDGALLPADARVHLEGCDVCSLALEEARRRATAIEVVLGALGTSVDTDAAKRRARARMDARRAAERPRRSWAVPLGRAATILLVAGGAAYALPGSPVRSWFEGTPGEATATGEASTAGVPLATTGIDIPVPSAGVRVELHGVAPGAVVEVRWVDDPIARIVAAEGSSYALAEGRAEATVAAGPVRLDLPRVASAVTVVVNGTTLLRGTAASPTIAEGAIVAADGGLSFTVPRD